MAAGATIGDADEVWASDVVVKVNEPTADEIARLREGAAVHRPDGRWAISRSCSRR